ncbi:MAG: ABC transporter permease, partial [Acidobacteria bacterium]|nr:ABC transporter permease [Acidobacteriota bacterium]
MRRVWYGRWFDAIGAFGRDMRVGLRSLMRTKVLTATVVITLALGIGANAAIFSVVRGVLFRPLVNRGEDRLIYIRQSAPGIGADNTTFSVPEIDDFRSRATTVSAFGDFSTVEFVMTGLGGEPRTIRAGVVDGSFFDVMGLRPVLGRLLTPEDDGPQAAGAAVLTHRFWTESLNRRPDVIGTTLRLGTRTATIVGVLEPSVPYPADTEIIANVVTSPHHLGATMTTSRTHRMTELFARLTPDASIDAARAELTAIHVAMTRDHPEAYADGAGTTLHVTRLRDQLAAPARTVLWLLFIAFGIVFVIACSNVANLILARSARRQGELAVRAALGASPAALRRTLLAESLVLCGAGAALGVWLARPLVAVIARYASRYSVRALDVTVDGSLLAAGAALAMVAAVLLAYLPSLPSSGSAGFSLAGNGLRVTAVATRRLRMFATMQVACSFVLLAGAATLLAALVALHTAPTRIDTRRVIAVDIPVAATGAGFAAVVELSKEAIRRISDLPGVTGVAAGSFTPWRDAGSFPRFQFVAEGYTPADGEDAPHARIRMVSPRFFAVLGVPLVAGRDFTDDDRAGGEPVVIVSESIAERLFPDRDAVNRRLSWTDSGPGFCRQQGCRIIGVVADIEDESIVPGPALTIYHAMQQAGVGDRLFVHTTADPYALVPQITRVIRELSADQPVERAATLADVRADVLAPDRLNAFVLSGFAGVAMLIAAVGVAGVLAFLVSTRTREFGIRLAVGSTPRRLLLGVLGDGGRIIGTGIMAGVAGGAVFGAIGSRLIDGLQMPGMWPLAGAAALLAGAGVIASLLPA